MPALNHSITYKTQTVVNCLNNLLCTEMRVESRKERRGEGGGDEQREKERGGEEKEGKMKEEEGKRRGWKRERERRGLT